MMAAGSRCCGHGKYDSIVLNVDHIKPRHTHLGLAIRNL
jgi:hypothetical protein